MILTCPNCDTRFHVAPETFGPGRRKVRCSRCRHIWQQDPLPEPEPEAPPPPSPPPPQEEEFPIPPRRLVIEPEPEPMPPPPAAPPPPPIPDEPISRVMNIELDGDDGLDGIDRPPLHPPFDGPAEPALDEDPDAVLAQRRERLARAGMQRPAAKPRKARSFAWVGWLLLFALLGGLVGGGYEKRNELIAFYPPLAKLYEQLGIPVDAAEWLGLELHNLKSSTIIEGGETKIAISGEVVNVGKTERAVPGIRVAMRGSDRELNAYTLTLDQTKIEAGATLPFDVKLPAPKDEVTDLEVAFASQQKH